MESDNAVKSKPDRFASLQLRPAVRQTVVITTTTTTVHYAPIQIPRPPSPELTGDYGDDRARYPLQLAIRRRKGGKEGQHPHHGVVGLSLGDNEAVYTSDSGEAGVPGAGGLSEEKVYANMQADRKGKRRMRPDEEAEYEKEMQNSQAPQSEDRAAKRRRIASATTFSATRLASPETEASSQEGSSLSKQRRSVVQSQSMQSSVPEATVLPSPTLSPRLEVDDPFEDSDAHRHKQVVPFQKSASHGGPEDRVVEEVTQAVTTLEPEDNPRLNLGSGFELSTLMSLKSLVNSFSALPNNLQTHVLYDLLRHASTPVIQSINLLIQPALKRDFISDLPAELSVQVLSYLDSKTIITCLSVSKNWKRFLNCQGKIWSGLMKVEDLWTGGGGGTNAERREFEHLSRVGVRKRNGQEVGIKELLAMEDGKTGMFLKRWKAGTWDEGFDLEKAARPTALKLMEVNRAAGLNVGETSSASRPGRLRRSDTRPQVARQYSSSRLQHLLNSPPPAAISAAQSLPAEHDYIHPFKLLYKKRVTVRKHWYRAKPPHRVTFAGQNSNIVTALQFDNEKLVSASDDPNIDVYDTQTGQLKMRLRGHEGGVWALQYIGDILVSGSTDRTTRVWDLQTGNCTHVFTGHTSTVRCLQIVEPVNVNPDPNGTPVWEPPYPLIVTGARDSTVRVWRLPFPTRGTSSLLPYAPPSPSDETNEPSTNPFHLRCLRGHEAAIRAIAAHGRTVVSGSYDCTLRVWDLLTGECRHRLVGHIGKVYSVIIDPERNQCASGSLDGTVRLWSMKTGEALFKLDGHSSLVGLLALSFHYLVSAGADSTLKVWNPATGDLISTLAAHAGAITCFKHDDFRVVSGTEGQLRLWDIRKGRAIRDLVDNMGGAWQCQFSDRYIIAAVQRDGMTDFEILDFFPELRKDADSSFLSDEDSAAYIAGDAQASLSPEPQVSEIHDDDSFETPMNPNHGAPPIPYGSPSAHHFPPSTPIIGNSQSLSQEEGWNHLYRPGAASTSALPVGAGASHWAGPSPSSKLPRMFEAESRVEREARQQEEYERRLLEEAQRTDPTDYASQDMASYGETELDDQDDDAI